MIPASLTFRLFVVTGPTRGFPKGREPRLPLSPAVHCAIALSRSRAAPGDAKTKKSEEELHPGKLQHELVHGVNW